MRGERYKPFKLHLSQTLHPGDQNRRMQFCNWLLNKTGENPNFCAKILWSDECNFSNLGLFNRKNEHIWSIQNPRQYVEVRNQNRFGFNVWAGILNNRLLGPLIYEGTLNANRYLEFLRGPISEYLDNLPLLEVHNMWWQQDGAPPHNSILVKNYLHEAFPGQWIGNGGAVEWSARSPDLSPLDYFLWGNIKNTVYKQRYANIGELQDSVVAAFDGIPGRNIERAVRSIERRAQMCIQENGSLFEHLL